MTLLSPFTVSEKGIIRNKSGSGIVPGIVIDTETAVSGSEHLVIDGLFENHAVLEIASGGMTGDFRNYGTLLITNNISLAPPIFLDCENEGVITQDGSFHYQRFTAKPGSLHQLFTTPAAVSYINPDFEGAPSLHFEKGSSIEAIGSRSIIEFPTADEPNLQGQVDIFSDAELTIQKANTGPAKIISVKDEGLLKFEDTTFERLTVKGEGASSFSGTVQPNSDNAWLRIGTKTFLIADATFIGLEYDAVTPTHDTALYQFFPIGAFKQVGIIKDSLFSERSFVHASVDTDVFMQSGITLDGTFRFEGNCDLSAPILKGADPDVYGTLWAGYYLRGQANLTVAPNIAEIVTVPYLNITGSKVNVTIYESTHLQIQYNSFVNVGKLTTGNWTIHDFAACDLGQQGPSPIRINEIQEGASVKLGKPHPTVPSFGLILDQQQNFAVGGKLELEYSTLNMNGHTLYNNNNIIFGPGSKLIGNIESIRNEVQGVIQLAGNFNIEGNLTTDSVISLGASPGFGLITGDLTLLPGSEMIVEIGGTDPGTEFDYLEVGGVTTIDGTLYLSLIDEYVPDVDDTFLFLKSGSTVGAFTGVDQAGVGRMRRFDLNSVADGLSLTSEEILIGSYADWRSHFFSVTDAADDAISGMAADPDSDGLSNLSEYLHATFPYKSDPPPFSFDFSDRSNIRTEVQWAKAILDYDWELQKSTDLAIWENVTFTSELVEESSDKGLYRIQIQITPTSDPKVFYRYNARELPSQ